MLPSSGQFSQPFKVGAKEQLSEIHGNSQSHFNQITLDLSLLDQRF